MLTKFWEVVGQKLAERWFTIVGPPAVFWGVALGLWLAEDDANLERLRRLFVGEPTGLQVLRLSGLLAVVVLSALAVRALTLPVLRLLEGYWPDWPGVRTVRRWLLERRWVKLEAATAEWRQLAATRSDWGQARPAGATDTAAWAERAERASRYAQLDSARRLAPTNFSDARPTRLGNVLAAAETRPNAKYGLDVVLCWPAMWLVLPEDARKAVAEARVALDGAVVAMIWGALGFSLAVLNPLAAPAALVVLLVGYGAVRRAAEGFGALLEATFDVHRAKLYGALRIEPPTDARSEPDTGRKVSAHLLRGGGQIVYAPPASGKTDGS